MTNSQKNLVTLRIIKKKNIASSKASHDVTLAEITSGSGQFKDGYVVIASVEEGKSIHNSFITIPSSNIMAVVGASLSQYALKGNLSEAVN